MNLSALSTVLTLLPLGKDDPTWGDNPALTQQFLPAIWETLLMVFFGTLLYRARWPSFGSTSCPDLEDGTHS